MADKEKSESDLLKSVSPAGLAALASEFAPPGAPVLVTTVVVTVALLLGWLATPVSLKRVGQKVTRRVGIGLGVAFLVLVGIYAGLRHFGVTTFTEGKLSEEQIVSLWKSDDYRTAKADLEKPDDTGQPGKKAPPQVVIRTVERQGKEPWSEESYVFTVGILWASLVGCAAVGCAWSRYALTSVKELRV